MSQRDPKLPGEQVGTRHGRGDVWRRLAAGLGRRRLLLFWLGFLSLLAPSALATPRRSDETAVLVAAVWAVAWLSPARRRRGVRAVPARRGRGRPPRMSLLPARVRLLLAAAGYLAGGLLVYWLSLSCPPAGLVRPTGGRAVGPRACTVVVTQENPIIVGRVIAVNADCSLIIDGGVDGEGGETIHPAGIDGFSEPPMGTQGLGDVTRAVKEAVLGRVVTVRIVDPNPDRLMGLVFTGVGEALASGQGSSINETVWSRVRSVVADPPFPREEQDR